MYNLFVSGNTDAWQGEPWQIELSRCVREYTDNAITERLGALDDAAVAELKRLPSIFAYEAVNKADPKFGMIRDLVKRQGQVRIAYGIIPLTPFLTAADLTQLTFELDIGEWEMNSNALGGQGRQPSERAAHGERHYAATLDPAGDQDGRHHQTCLRCRAVLSRRGASDRSAGGAGIGRPDRPELLLL